MRNLSLLLVTFVSACSSGAGVTEALVDVPTGNISIIGIDLSSLAPSAGTTTTQIIATGTFSHSATQPVRILFNDEWVVPSYVEENRIGFFPPDRASGKYDVRVQIGSLVSNPVPFSLQSQIENIGHFLIGTRKYLQLYGKGLTGMGQVEIGSLELPVLFAGATTVVTRWPSELRPGKHYLRFVNGGVYSSDTPLDVAPQMLYILPEDVTGGDIAVAYGANFPEIIQDFLVGYDRVYGEVTAPVSASSVTSITFSVPFTAPPGVVFRWADNFRNWHAFKIWPAFDSITPATAVTSETITVMGRNLGWGITSFIPEDLSASLSLGGQTWPCPCKWYPTVVTITVPTSLSSGEASLFLHPFEPYLAEPDLRGVYAVTTVTVAP